MQQDKKTCKMSGRSARKPSTQRRLSTRPDLFRKARNVLSQNGEAALTEWSLFRTEKRHDPFHLVARACDAALS